MFELDPGKSISGVIVVDIEMSNINGDPNAGHSSPRLTNSEDESSVHSWMTDTCPKRKFRDFAAREHGASLYVARNAILSEVQKRSPNIDDLLLKFWDCRVFGVTATQFLNAGRITGPVQVNITQSVTPSTILPVCLTRVAGEKKEDLAEGTTGKKTVAKNDMGATMGNKDIVQHALYLIPFTYSANEGMRTKVTKQDLAILVDAMIGAWSADRATARTGVSFRGLHMWQHSKARFGEHTHVTFDRVKATLKDGVVRDTKFEDFNIVVDHENEAEHGLTYAGFNDSTAEFPVPDAE